MLGVTMLLLPVFGRFEIPAAVLVILWGVAFGALPLALQGWMLKAAPGEMESASTMWSSVLQIGVAAGSLFGGVSVDHLGLNTTFIGSGCIAGLTAAMVLVFGRDANAG